MKTIGKFLKEARTKKRYSLKKIADQTKIKKEFIVLIEKEEWEALPEFSAVVGFVKRIAESLQIDERQAIALLRRDYPPKVLPVNPKPDISKKFTWSPKLTFFISISFAAFLLLGYLGFQYLKFMSSPVLIVDVPQEGQVITEKNLLVLGKTDPDATIKVNNQPVLTDDDGRFKAEIEIYEGTTEVVVKAISRSGKETVVHRKIIPDFNE